MSQQVAEQVADLESYRDELRGYCYRMLGSAHDADDAAQDALVKAWQAWNGFEGRASVRSWLYRIATNVCLDSLRARKRRALPMDLSSPVPATTAPVDTRPDAEWLEPMSKIVPTDPAQQAVQRDGVRLAFVAALQTLPARQRAVLVLREVLCWRASEVAELLDTTVASVNSALQRARATLGAVDRTTRDLTPADLDLLQRYVAAFEAYDIPSLVSLLHEDASISMPPYSMWLQGVEQLPTWYLGYGAGCRGSRLVPTTANGCPAFGHYKIDPAGGHEPWCVQVLELRDGRVEHIHHFLDTSLFRHFGLPDHLD